MQILLVDDSSANLAVYRRILGQIPDVGCVGFPSPEDGLAWAVRNDPDLILVDYQMPSMNGLEFVAALRKVAGRELTPLVMITAPGEKSVRHRALELGVTDFLVKPADPLEFLARARNMLAQRDAQKKLSNKASWLAAEVKRATAEIAEREREAIFQLLRVAEFRDNDTASHIVRIGHFAALLATSLGMPTEESELLRLAAPMHDIGKVATPDNILLKRGKLTPEEWKIMREHTVAGHEILKSSKSKLLQTGGTIALTHHEKFDGSGYPSGLRGDAIPIAGRITALVDVFDALTSERPYKKAWSISEALDRIRADSGTHFDPKLVETFFSVVPALTTIKLRYSDTPRVA
ncbi:MAG: response regulator [Candidatus Eremiobacteraeota bacterium]|nr:response regulator [Candidatus Eremiobacteraeota bacterium]